MKTLKTNNSQFDSFKNTATSFPETFRKKEKYSDFDFFLEELLKEKEDLRDWDEYPVLLPRHGRFWDNGYEDVE